MNAVVAESEALFHNSVGLVVSQLIQPAPRLLRSSRGALRVANSNGDTIRWPGKLPPRRFQSDFRLQ
jgi:hypothetical protein